MSNTKPGSSTVSYLKHGAHVANDLIKITPFEIATAVILGLDTYIKGYDALPQLGLNFATTAIASALADYKPNTMAQLSKFWFLGNTVSSSVTVAGEITAYFS